MEKVKRKIMRSIVSVCTGDKYPNSYVETLYNMVSRHTEDFTFYCITDKKRGLKSPIQEVVVEKKFHTWWNKVHMFNKDMPFKGTVLYLDLDVVIFRNINKLWTFMPNDFCIIQDFNRCRIPNYSVKNSSVMKFPHGKHHDMYEKFCKEESDIMRKYRGDQDYVTRERQKAVLWPREWIMSYKWEIGLEPGEKRRFSSDKFVKNKYRTEERTKMKNGRTIKKTYFVKDGLPDECSIAVFHGKPDPGDIQKDPLIINHWR